MQVALFTILSSLTGGHVRILETTYRYPRRPTFLIPRNYYIKLLSMLDTYYEGRFREFIVNNTIELPPMEITHFYAYPKYIYDAMSKIKGDLNYFDIFYIPHEHVGMMMLLKSIGVKWTALLQLTPVVGALDIDLPINPIRLMSLNLKLNGMGYLGDKLFEYLIAKAVLSGEAVLAVSRSIPYEMRLMGLKARVKVLDPGIGIDESCLRCGDKDIDIIFLGRLRREKGVFDFIRVINILHRGMRLKPRVLIMGASEGDDYRAVKSFIRRLRLDGIIEVKVNLTRRELLSYLARAKVFVYPTRLDSIGLVVVEALAHGVPVVTYDIPAMRLNYRTKAVLRVPFRDVYSMALATASILSDEEYRERLANEGLRFVRRFDWVNVAMSEWEALSKVAYEEGESPRVKAMDLIKVISVV